ncbi:MAG TPA: PAS domain S-box protein, partial [Bacteroidota bacterium]|nr:PAS domain S-box protein [Bacteroidota bacterium]
DGLFLYNLSSKRWTNCKLTGLDARNRVNEIVRARDKSLWLATEGGLVVRRPDGSVTTIREVGGRSLGSLTGLIEDDEGRIWCSSGAAFDGAYRWDGLKWEYFPISNDPAGVRVHKIRKDRFGRIWLLAIGKVYSPQLGTDPGAFVYENGRCRKWGVAEGLLSGRVYSFAQGQDGSLWFGTWRGLSRWKDNRWTYWTSKEGLRGDVYSLAIDHQNRVWLGNLTAELAYIQNDSVKYVQTDECPLRGAVWDMQLDETGGLWISGRTEVVAYRNGKWFSFTPKSGMEQSKIWPVLPSDDKVFVGTFGKGVDILNLDQKPSPYPRVLIEKALIEHETVLLRWHAFAFWGEQPENEILTRYSVDDRQWSSWSMGKDVTIEGLDPGNHRLEVQAKGLLADFETPGARASFFIESPYYQRPLFLIPGLAGFATIMWLGVALVVRKRRHAASLRQSELKFRRLTEATFEGIAIHDRGVILDANESILKMFGYSYDEFVGKSIQEIAAQESHLLIDESMTSDPERAHEVVGIRKDGSKIIIEITSKSIPYEHRSARVIAVRDISERKKSEEQLLAYQEQLRTLATEVSATEERERRRMAEYLHDHIGQALAMCKLKLEAIKNGEHSAKIDESRQILQQVIDHTRSLTLDLSPPVLRELSFADAIEWLTVQFQNQHNILIYFEDDKQPKTLGADLKTFLYHAVRELLTNIIKHARAQSAEVILRKNDNALFIEVKDDGIGLDSATIRHRHDKDGFGLFNIRERLRHYGGSLDITPLAEEGTCIVMTLPLTPTQDHE